MNTKTQYEMDMLFIHYPALLKCKKEVENAFGLMLNCSRNKGLIMTCGNGGSAADAEHIVGELMKDFKCKRPLHEEQCRKLKNAFPEESDYFIKHLQRAIPAISLVSQSAISTAFINDVSGDMVYAQQVLGYGKPGDVLIAISTSGNSKNVVNACKVAKSFGIKTIGMTGESGGVLSEFCDIVIRVPAHETFRVQEYHLPVYHTLCAMMETEIFAER